MKILKKLGQNSKHLTWISSRGSFANFGGTAYPPPLPILLENALWLGRIIFPTAERRYTVSQIRGGGSIISGKGPESVPAPFGNVPCRSFNRPRKRKIKIRAKNRESNPYHGDLNERDGGSPP